MSNSYRKIKANHSILNNIPEEYLQPKEIFSNPNKEKLVLKDSSRLIRGVSSINRDDVSNGELVLAFSLKVNMMGSTKRIMEFFLNRRSVEMPVSTACFANVAFSDGSLLYGFNRRLDKNQPLSAPNDVRRYFDTPKEAGQLCVMSCLLGEKRDVFFPKLDHDFEPRCFLKHCRKISPKPRL